MAAGAPPTFQSNPDELANRRLQTHLAEYNALTTRLTYWITLQYATYVIAAGAFGFIAQAWGHIEARQLAWACILVLLALLWALAYTNSEIFTYVAYIETDLRLKLKPLVEDDSFWRFERYMTMLRRKRFISFEQKLGLFPLFACAIVLPTLVIIRSSLHTGRSLLLSNGVWFVCAFYVALIAFLQFRFFLALQKTAVQSFEQGT